MNREEELMLLKQAGVGRKDLSSYAAARSDAEALCALRQARRRLLDQIHLRQRALDRIDLLLYEKQRERDR